MSHLRTLRSSCRRLLPIALVLCSNLTSLLAADPAADLEAARHKAIEFLRTTQQDNGCWTTADQPGLTGLVTTAILKSGVPASDPMAVKALNFLEKLVQTDGGIYNAKGNHRNYETCIALMAFQAAHQEQRFQKILKDAEKYVREQQWDEGEGKDKNDPFYGGAGYGSKSRPDLSNTHFLLDALKAAGAGPDDPAIQKALVFVSRCQNLETTNNTTEFAAKINDGGFYYTPAAGGSSMAGNDPNGGLRSYASMTYAGLKSMIYAGVNADDPRVKAAVSWIKKHYSITENPGMQGNGLYYYYNTFAKALSVLGQDQFVDADGKSHDWRTELRTHLLSLQKENGSWVNPTPRWLEGDPNLATAYALMALEYCAPKSAAK